MKIAPGAFIVTAAVVLLIAAAITACNNAEPEPEPENHQPVMAIIPDAPDVTPAGDPVKEICTGCHPLNVQMIESSNHAVHDCAQCHIPGNHPDNPLLNESVVNQSHELCGGCHPDQYQSFLTINLESEAKLEKATPTGVSPLFDKLLAPYGFTKEHDEPRSHAFMVIDHLTVDRAYGGRFQLENWQDILASGNVWDILVDMGAQYTMPESARAANPVCLNCKTNNHILEWAYLGDENMFADWDRTSDVVEFVQALESPAMGCIICHDPHTTSHRVVRDGLIEAVEEKGAFPYMSDGGESLASLEVVEFRGFRKIGLLDEPVANVMCAQCHVEYVCNPGIDTSTGEYITMADSRTNHFPWVNVFDIYEHYQELGFRDFKHAITGATLVKLQHPDAETNWGSLHQTNGVECSDCHMPKLTNAAGETYTSHWQTSPRTYIDKTCLSCHTEWTEQEAEYRIDSIQNYVKGKLSKAEYWLGRLIDTFEVAIRGGISQDTLDEAREYHSQAHILWEWWTAGNSGGFHNPDQARESLTRSVEFSKLGIEVLENALK